MKNYEIEINGETYRVAVKELAADADMTGTKSEKTNTAASEATKVSTPTAEGTEIKAPMAGTIVNVAVSVGQEVSEGDVLGILEAMKMENEIIAPVDGVVQEILVNPNDSVQSDQILFIL